MPLIRVTTNVALGDEVAQGLAVDAGAILSETLGKPERVCMALVEAGKPLAFGGSGESAALFEIEGIETGAGPTGPLCEALSDFAEERLGVAAERVFVKVTDVPRGYWAGNRRVF